MLAGELNKMIAEALKSRDEIRLSTLRMLLSALNYEKIAKQHELAEEEELAIIRREARKRQDSIDAYEKVGAKDRAEKEKKELSILKEMLPPELSDEDVGRLIDESINSLGVQTISEMGKVIGDVVEKSKGAADGRKVAQMVKDRLQ